MANGRVGDRRGLLLKPEHLEKTEAPRPNEIPPQLVMEFFRELVRNTGNTDLIQLCAYIAQAKSESTDEERIKLLRMIL